MSAKEMLRKIIGIILIAYGTLCFILSLPYIFVDLFVNFDYPLVFGSLLWSFGLCIIPGLWLLRVHWLKMLKEKW